MRNHRWAELKDCMKCTRCGLKVKSVRRESKRSVTGFAYDNAILEPGAQEWKLKPYTPRCTAP